MSVSSPIVTASRPSRSASCILAPVGEHLRPDLPPEHLRDRVVARTELRRAACPDVGLLEPVERVERLRQISGRGRQEALLSELVEKPAPFFSQHDTGSRIARQELDDDRILAQHRPQEESTAAVGKLRADFG